MKRTCIIQSSYLPWLGFFDMIRRSDEYIVLDDVQYTKRDWRNRNYFKFHSCVGRLTVPVMKGSRSLKIEEVETADDDWALRHWKSLSQTYSKAPYFASFKDYFEPVYKNPPKKLTDLNLALIKAVCEALSIKTKITRSTDYGRFEGKNDRLIKLCESSKTTNYLSGPKATNYLDETRFNSYGIVVEWMKYDYPPYRQLHGGPFVPNLSILDCLFNEGPGTIDVMKASEETVAAV